MMKCILAIAVLLAGTTFRTSAMPEKVSENKPESIKVEITEGQIDVISGIIYSQVISTRSNRALRMTVLVPRTRTPNLQLYISPEEDSHLQIMRSSSKCVWHWPKPDSW